jgi:predicted CXXCH cytochrome family protein
MIVRLTALAILIGLGASAAPPTDDAPPPEGGIVGSKHDFSQQDWSQQQICLPCHTPHSTKAPDAGPLWDTSPDARESYTLYDGSRGLPGPGSLICLSCHDGSVAADTYGGTTGDIAMSTGSIVGRNRDLRQDHPVGVGYPDHDPGYHPRAQVEAAGRVPLPQGRVECLSCHDVHNQFGVEKLLVMSNKRSALCLACHRK